MADPVIKKRPVILRLAELKRYPTLDDRYAATLPFKAGPANCGCFWDLEICQSWCDSPPSVVEKCIRRTGERWAVSPRSGPNNFVSCQQAQCCKCKKMRLTGNVNIVVLISTRFGRHLRQTPRHSDLSPLGDPPKNNRSAVRRRFLLLRYRLCPIYRR